MIKRAGFVFLLGVCLASAGVRPTVGTITSSGRIQIEGAEVWGQGTILDGAAISVGKSASRLLMRDGSDLRLASGTGGQVFAQRVLLEQGAVEGLLSPALNLETKAMGLSVKGENARAHVKIDNGGTVTIASLEGAVHVRNRAGQLLAALAAGNAVQLSPASSEAQASTQLTGEMSNKNYRYFIVDEATGVKVEVRGENAARFVGKRVKISGEIDASATPAEGAQYVVRLSSIERAAGAALAGGAAAKGGVGTLTKVAIIGGVVVAGATTTGLVVAGDSEEPRTVSP